MRHLPPEGPFAITHTTGTGARSPAMSYPGDPTGDALDADPLRLAGAILAGRYRVDRCIGRGGTASVYTARDLERDRQVALKIGDAAWDPARVGSRLAREAESLERLHHPNVITLYDHQVCGRAGLRLLALDLVPGIPLSRLLEAGPLPLSRFRTIALPLASAVAHVHQRGMVHRDIKPGNVLLGWPVGAGRVVQCDIEQALTADDPPDARFGGSVGYIAPEQIRSPRYDPRSDVYGLGATFYRMLGGRTPTTDPNTDRLVPLRHPDPLPSALVDLVERCLAVDPTDRLPDAVSLHVALDEALAGIAESANPALPSTGTPRHTADQPPTRTR